MKARITPEHNVRQKSYAVQAVCDEAEETVISVECLDCAAHLGTISFVYFVFVADDILVI